MLAGCNQVTAPPETPTASASPSAPASPPADLPAGLDRFYTQDVAWEECGQDAECADVTVPLDYDDPDAGEITLAVKRLRSAGADRVGSLLINPGGPGGSGIELVDAAQGYFSEDLLGAYDLVGFDPRGVDASTAIDCVDDAELDRLRSAEYDLTTDAGLSAYQDDLGIVREGCAARSGDLLGHVDTESAARDMDVLRHLLGEPELDYLGFSYGTFLGATYAELFPDRVGNLVLDGAMDPALDTHGIVLGQAAGFEDALRAYVADCQSGSDCPLTGGVEEGVAQVQRLLEVARATPLPTASDRPLTASLAFSGIITPLYDDATWFVLTTALDQAINQRDGSQLLYLADLTAGRESDGTYSNNSVEANWAINCLDFPARGDLAQWQEEAEELRATAPVLGEFLAFGDMLCDQWPVDGGREPAPVDADGAGPIMVVGTTGDPATPYPWSESLTEELAEGFLVTYDGEGHTAYGSSNECVTDAVDAFLIEGTRPEGDLRC
ncbi:alpha/beta hydrolase [Georgenia sp. TF02-10]|uniref:alpha/beta hydrolase n=1 Tax=Georgenia sp. TF02-10 TaxID=2917725 RepID=UPI00352DD0A7